MALENLDELIVRRDRMAGATWGPDNMENATTRVWQPETVMYNDIITGKEVWRMSSTPDRSTFYHNDISWTHWSSDGHWLVFASDRDTNAFTRDTGRRIWMIMETNGSLFQPTVGSSRRGYWSQSQYVHWDPQTPDIFFDTGSNDDDLALSPFRVYKMTVAVDGTITNEEIIDTSLNGGNTRSKIFSKTISGDGLKALLRDHFIASGDHLFYPCTLTDGSEVCDEPAGYPLDRDQGAAGNTLYSDQDVSFTREHSGALFLSGNSSVGYRINFHPSGANLWWSYIGMTGSAADGGHVWTDPGSSGEIIVEATRFAPHNPFFTGDSGIIWWGHVSPNWGGTHFVYHNTESDNSPGIVHEQISDRTLITRSYFGDYISQHNDWHGFSDYTITSRSHATDGNGMRLVSTRYDDTTETDSTVICYVHSGANGGTADRSLTRPFISPDGTKAAFHSEFLNLAANQTDCFWAVVRYPKPPTTVRATASGANINLTWTTPSYTNIGWPALTDSAPTSKEIKGYHVWVSNNGSTEWTELTTTAVSSGYDTAQSNSTTKYYAVTSEEYSILESRELSEIRKIVRDGSGVVTDTQHDAEGVAGWWVIQPPNPLDNEFSIPSGGPYSLAWTEPDDLKIRFYHIYYAKASETLVEDQQHRIASVPVGTSSFIDWLADPTEGAEYSVVSVDRYGNIGTTAKSPVLAPPVILGFIA